VKRLGATTFQEAWSRSVGPNTSWIVSAIVTALTFGACLAYSSSLELFSGHLLQHEPALICDRYQCHSCHLPACFCLCARSGPGGPSALLAARLLGAYSPCHGCPRYFDGSYAAGGRSCFASVILAASVYLRWRRQF
jgi:hypothetical protein